MDPRACLVAAAEAIRAGDVATANDWLEEYADWRRNHQGFEPIITGADVWHTRLIGNPTLHWDGDDFHALLECLLLGDES